MELKRDSSTALVDAIQFIENRSDLCFDNLSLYAVPRWKAFWGILTYLVLRTEDER
jgi:hypothetical protein